jgi:hypothetical protein
MGNYTSAGHAQQDVALFGVTVSAPAGYGVSMFNDAEGDYSATQTLTVDGGSISAYYVALGAFNATNWYGMGAGATATQEIALTGVSVSSTAEDAVVLNNGAWGDGAAATYYTAGVFSTASQSFSATNLGTDALSINGYWDGIDAENATYGGYSQATQTISLSGMNVTGTNGQGLDLSNYADAENSEATQDVEADNGSLADDYGPVAATITGATGIAGENDADNYYAEATQTIVLSGVSVSGTSLDGVRLDNQAWGYAGAVATQSFAADAGNVVGGVAIQGQVDGVEGWNWSEDLGVAQQDIAINGVDLTGTTGNGLYLDNEADDGSTAEQTVDVLSATITGDDNGAWLVNDGNDGDSARQIVRLVDPIAGAVNIEATYNGIQMDNSDASGYQQLTAFGDVTVGQYVADIRNYGGEQLASITGTLTTTTDQSGIYVYNSDGAQTVNLAGALVAESAGNGVYVEHYEGAQDVDVAFSSLVADTTGVYVTNNSSAGQKVYVTNGAYIDATNLVVNDGTNNDVRLDNVPQ